MKTVELTKATASLAQYARGMKKGAVILTTRGRPVAALIVITNADLETIRLSTDPKFLKIIERSRVRYQKEGGIGSDEMRRRLGLKIKARHNGR